MQVLVAMFELLQDIWKPFTPKTEEKWKELIQELGKYTAAGLCISPAERDQIVKAMGLPSGHWYTCPNGHVYAIADCGGAVHVTIFFFCTIQLIFALINRRADVPTAGQQLEVVVML